MSRKPKGQPKTPLAPAGGWSRTPKATEQVPTARTPRREFRPDDPDGKIIIQFGRFDIGGPWCLTSITREDHAALLARIRSIERMTVLEAFNNGEEPGKDYEVGRIPNTQALSRLRELEYDDETRISRLRISGPGRLYGFRRGDRFYALWWDPEHTIWPSVRRNT